MEEHTKARNGVGEDPETRAQERTRAEEGSRSPGMGGLDQARLGRYRSGCSECTSRRRRRDRGQPTERPETERRDSGCVPLCGSVANIAALRGQGVGGGWEVPTRQLEPSAGQGTGFHTSLLRSAGRWGTRGHGSSGRAEGESQGTGSWAWRLRRGPEVSHAGVKGAGGERE